MKLCMMLTRCQHEGPLDHTSLTEHQVNKTQTSFLDKLTQHASGITHERLPNFKHQKKDKKKPRKTERAEFITPPYLTGRRSNKHFPY